MAKIELDGRLFKNLIQSSGLEPDPKWARVTFQQIEDWLEDQWQAEVVYLRLEAKYYIAFKQDRRALEFVLKYG